MKAAGPGKGEVGGDKQDGEDQASEDTGNLLADL